MDTEVPEDDIPANNVRIMTCLESACGYNKGPEARISCMLGHDKRRLITAHCSDAEYGVIQTQTQPVKRIRYDIATWFAVQKMRFDWGSQLLTYTNFVLLMLTASDKIRPQLPFAVDIYTFIAVGMALMFLGVWLLGYVLDNHIKIPATQMGVVSTRNPWNNNVESKLNRIIHLLEDGKD